MTISQDLIERVRGLTGPDREVDGHLALMAGWKKIAVSMPDINGNTVQVDLWFPDSADEASISEWVAEAKDEVSANLWRDYDDYPAYTASIDAALALAERVLPWWVCEHIGQEAVGRLGEMKGIGWTAEFSNGLNTHQGQAPTLPLAIVLATLIATQSSETSNADRS